VNRDRRNEIVTSLREVANLLESIDDPTALPEMSFDCYSSIKVYNFDVDPDGDPETRWEVDEKATKARVVSAMRLLKGTGSRAGKIEKKYYGDSFTMERKFAGLRISISTERNAVCTAKVVGTATEKVMKYIDTGETKEVPVIEWECDPILAPTES
jgi:hypothetical protein